MRSPARLAVAAAIWFGVFTSGGLLTTLQWRINFPANAADWPHVLLSSLLLWYTSAIASLAPALLAWFRPLHRRYLARDLTLYLIVCAAASAGRIAMAVPLHNAFIGTHDIFATQLRVELIGDVLGMIAIGGIVMAIRYYVDARDREVRAVTLEAELTRARLDALQAQLHPHFLFNTLHGVSTLMHRNVDQADEMLSRLCDLLRITLERSNRSQITLGDELAMLERYVDIMEMRFPSRLHVTILVPADLRAAPVPALLLQPLVENVLQHGLDEKAGTVDISVSATRDAGTLVLVVADNGRGLAGDGTPKFGIGLENTKRRLETLYGAKSSLVISKAARSGTRVELVIPFGSPA